MSYLDYILQWNDGVMTDNSIEKVNIDSIEPHQGTDLNKSGELRMVINNEDQFIHPSRSHLYIEGVLEPKTGRKYEATDHDKVGLVNNGIMYLFNRVEYKIGDKKIEGYYEPGRATTMKGLLTYPREYTEGMAFHWKLDDAEKTVGNEGFKQRAAYIHNGHGHFSVLIPLTHIFGFCENYEKVMYGLKHELLLYRRSPDDDAILKSDEKDGANDAVAKAVVKLTKVSWRMPRIYPSDEAKVKLYKDIESKKTLPIQFLHRQCESLTLNSDQKHMDWKFSLPSGSERPRYIILGFQKDKYEDQNTNSGVFDHLQIENARVELNGDYYPNTDMNLDWKNNKFTLAYQTVVDYLQTVANKESCSIRFQEYRPLYPLLVFDVSRQREKLKGGVSDIRIKANFDSNTNTKCRAYALVLSDREISLQCDGERMHVIE